MLTTVASSARRGTLSPPEFEFVRSLLYERSAMVLEPHKQYLAESRLGPIALSQGYEDASAFLADMHSNRDLQDAFVEGMTINETSFFRDGHPFAAMQQHLLPSIVRRRQQSRQINIWCAACSSGQEPYSVAMLLRDHFSALRGWKITIYATDLSKAMVARTREGVYSQIEVMRGLKPSVLDRHFTQEGTMWRVRPELREMVRSKQLNLTDAWHGMPEMDFVLLRNVLIYFDGPTKEKVLEQMSTRVREGGFLMLGGSETTFGLRGAFERETHDRTAYYVRKAKTLTPMHRGTGTRYAFMGYDRPLAA
jgi:chemotaxis protein methyltransferase CheR